MCGVLCVDEAGSSQEDKKHWHFFFIHNQHVLILVQVVVGRGETNADRLLSPLRWLLSLLFCFKMLFQDPCLT